MGFPETTITYFVKAYLLPVLGLYQPEHEAETDLVYNIKLGVGTLQLFVATNQPELIINQPIVVLEVPTNKLHTNIKQQIEEADCPEHFRSELLSNVQKLFD